MIRINLLPVEYRRGNRISTKVLGTSFGAALAVAASIGWFGIVYFGQLGQLEQEHATLVTDLAEKQKKGAYYDKLEANRQDYTSRVQTIQDIGKSRRVWSKFMDELIDVVNNNGDTERHAAWFTQLTIKTDAKTKAAVVTLPGAVVGSEMSKVANLHQDMEQAPFIKDLASKSAPGGKLDVSKDRVPPEALEFPLELKFKSTLPEQPKKAVAPAKKN